jgi:hypothetical protein
MSHTHEPFLDALLDDLHPVRALRPVDGAALAVAATTVTAIALIMTKGAASSLISGEVSELFLIGNGMLLLLGLAAAFSVISMASPRVGNKHDGARWSIWMASVFPLTALALFAIKPDAWHILLEPALGLHCATWALGASGLIGVSLFAWLKRGAPVQLKTAGMHLGVAATALGSAIYGMTCHVDTIFHLGFWHALPVFAGGLVGRYAIAPLLRW